MIKTYIEKRDNGNYSFTMFFTELTIVSVISYFAVDALLKWLIFNNFCFNTETKPK